MGCAKDMSGKLKGYYIGNPSIDQINYEVIVSDGTGKEYTTNVVAEKILS